MTISDFTQEELKDLVHIDTNETMVCGHCKEHASPAFYMHVNGDGSVDLEYLGSDCCG